MGYTKRWTDEEFSFVQVEGNTIKKIAETLSVPIAISDISPKCAFWVGVLPVLFSYVIEYG